MKSNLKSIVIGALVGIALFFLLPGLASLAAENSFKVTESGDWVAVYPSVAKSLAMNPFILKALAFVILVAGSIVGVDLLRGSSSMKQPGIVVFVALAVAWSLQYFPADYKKDFTHQTIKSTEFVKKDADKGKYDKLFSKFYQEDPNYVEFSK